MRLVACQRFAPSMFAHPNSRVKSSGSTLCQVLPAHRRALDSQEGCSGSGQAAELWFRNLRHLELLSSEFTRSDCSRAHRRHPAQGGCSFIRRALSRR